MRKITDIIQSKGKWFLIILITSYFAVGNLVLTLGISAQQAVKAKQISDNLITHYLASPAEAPKMFDSSIVSFSLTQHDQLMWHALEQEQTESSLSLYQFTNEQYGIVVSLGVIPAVTQSSQILLAFNLMGIVLFSAFSIAAFRLFSPSMNSLSNIERWARKYLNDDGYVFKAPTENFLLEHALASLDKSKREAVNQPHAVDTYIREKTFLDTATGVGNRIFFDNRFEALLNESESDIHGSVFLIQLKELDAIQHLGGDSEVAHVLDQFIEQINNHLVTYQTAVFARRSDLDFSILLPQISLTEAEKIASRLIRLCKTVQLPEYIDQDHFFHLGVAYFQTGDAPYQILAEADMALRAAQLQGPSNWFMYDKGSIIKDMAKGSVRWRTALENALQKEAFVMLFQPVINMLTEEPHHNEVLARMRDEHANLVNASVFLPMARKCGLVPMVDKLIITKLVKLLEYEDNAPEMCSLNLNIDSLISEGFVDWLIAYLDEHQEAANKLIIELSEYHLVHYSDVLTPVLQRIKLANVKLLVDQVGLYMVSAQYIKDHDIDLLKLHSSIVRNINERSENHLFIRSLQGACAGTKVKIFALGVETEQEWQTLKQLGIAGAQGHYLSEPLEEYAPFKTNTIK